MTAALPRIEEEEEEEEEEEGDRRRRRREKSARSKRSKFVGSRAANHFGPSHKTGQQPAPSKKRT